MDRLTIGMSYDENILANDDNILVD